MLINPSNHGSCSKNCHSIDHFPAMIPNDGCFTPIYIYGLSSQFLDTFQAVEVLKSSLIVMSGPHCLAKISEYD